MTDKPLNEQQAKDLLERFPHRLNDDELILAIRQWELLAKSQLDSSSRDAAGLAEPYVMLGNLGIAELNRRSSERDHDTAVKTLAATRNALLVAKLAMGVAIAIGLLPVLVEHGPSAYAWWVSSSSPTQPTATSPASEPELPTLSRPAVGDAKAVAY